MGTHPVNYTKIALVLGLPMIAAVATGMGTHSWLLAVLALIATFVIAAAIAIKLAPTPAAFTRGTRAWEARMTNRILEDVIGERVAVRTVADPPTRARIDRELMFLSKQFDDNRAIIAANDASPGRGYIGFTAYREPTDTPTS